MQVGFPCRKFRVAVFSANSFDGFQFEKVKRRTKIFLLKLIASTSILPQHPCGFLLWIRCEYSPGIRGTAGLRNPTFITANLVTFRRLLFFPFSGVFSSLSGDSPALDFSGPIHQTDITELSIQHTPVNNAHVSPVDPRLLETADARSVWASCLAVVREHLKPTTFKTWFEPLLPTKLEASLLTVEVPSTYFYEWLEEHYFDLIQGALQQSLGPDARLQYAVRIPKQSSPVPARGETLPVNVLPFPAANGETEARAEFASNLNPKFTFENFIKGDGNQFARAAALNVANNPGETAFNPLVIYGGVGLGKTHLVQAIGNAITADLKGKRVFYASSEKFTIDFVESIEKNRTIDFSNFYRSVDVLILDDIQFFSGKERTQDTFFHTFNTLYQLKKQIVLSSDKPPKELFGLDERLISRFQCGLTVDIQPPDLETRIAILRKKADGDRIDIPQDVIEFIAANVKSNIRELEGCYIGLIARHTLEQKPLTVELAETVLKNVIAKEKKDITIEQIQRIVAEHFSIPENSLRAKSRKQEVVFPRQVAMYLAKTCTRASLKTIGLHFGGRDHSTIIYACRSIEQSMSDDEGSRAVVEQLGKKVSYLSE